MEEAKEGDSLKNKNQKEKGGLGTIQPKNTELHKARQPLHDQALRAIKTQKGLAFETGQEILSQKGHAIVGMSPGNSYFNKERIRQLLQYCHEHFSTTTIMISDGPEVHNLKAKGYHQEKAERKARLSGNTLRNHCNCAREELPNSNIQFISWREDVESNKEYQKELKEIHWLYETNESFKKAVTDAAPQNLQSAQQNDDTQYETAQYVLEELAFLLASPHILQTEKTGYVYHKDWPIYQNLIEGKFDGIQRKNLGIIVHEVS